MDHCLSATGWSSGLPRPAAGRGALGRLLGQRWRDSRAEREIDDLTLARALTAKRHRPTAERALSILSHLTISRLREGMVGRAFGWKR